MGNSQNKSSQLRNPKPTKEERESLAFTSQFSLSHFVGNLSGRSFVSLTSNQSVYSASRPWSRVSRRRWNDSTLKNPLEASKTAWPVAHKESIFLPEFPITTDLLQKEYIKQETIAKGAFGEVYKVIQVKEGKEYALKVLSKGKVVNENAVRQVKEEARIQTACGHHSFIAGAVSRWQTKKRLYIVSEYIPEGELLSLLEKYGKLPEELVKIFIAEIAIALDFLHNAGVIYRDLKPENILLDSDYHIKLIDFGLSKWLSIGSRTNTICGTLKYMAPEVLSREPYGHAVDWWSLGVIACKMLTDKVSLNSGKAETYGSRIAKEYALKTKKRQYLFPEPAVGVRAKNSTDSADVDESASSSQSRSTLTTGVQPGKLPDTSELSTAARGLLLRLLDRDPRVRMRSLRQLQQCAFYMRFNFEHVKGKKVSPKSVLCKYFPNGPPEPTKLADNQNQAFLKFDQACVV